MLGVPQGKVVLSAYEASWPDDFESERDRLVSALASMSPRVEHIGSTAVPGTRSKPLIDMMVGLDRLIEYSSCVPVLQGLGYEYKGEFGLPGRQFFVLGDPTTHHVHMVETGGHFWRLNLHFRDYLRSNPEARDRYARAKDELAVAHADCRADYTAAKDSIIRSLLDESGWRE